MLSNGQSRGIRRAAARGQVARFMKQLSVGELKIVVDVHAEHNCPRKASPRYQCQNRR